MRTDSPVLSPASLISLMPTRLCSEVGSPRSAIYTMRCHVAGVGTSFPIRSCHVCCRRYAAIPAACSVLLGCGRGMSFDPLPLGKPIVRHNTRLAGFVPPHHHEFACE